MESVMPADPPTSVKRKRADEPEENPPFTPEEYKDMCFDDASVVLQCLPGSIAFRVHRGVLSAQSEVFRDMFTLAQPDTASESTIAAPVIYIHDGPQKLYRLLKYIYRRQ